MKKPILVATIISGIFMIVLILAIVVYNNRKPGMSHSETYKNEDQIISLLAIQSYIHGHEFEYATKEIEQILYGEWQVTDDPAIGHSLKYEVTGDGLRDGKIDLSKEKINITIRQPENRREPDGKTYSTGALKDYVDSFANPVLAYYQETLSEMRQDDFLDEFSGIDGMDPDTVGTVVIIMAVPEGTSEKYEVLNKKIIVIGDYVIAVSQSTFYKLQKINPKSTTSASSYKATDKGETYAARSLPGDSDISNAETEIAKEKEARMKAYQQFLDGDITVDGINIDTISIPTGEPDARYATSYAYQDSNGDGLPELHVSSGRYYTVLSYKDNTLFEWAGCVPMGYYFGLTDGAFMRYDPRLWGEAFSYIIKNYSGETVYEVNFNYRLEDVVDGIDQYEYFYDGVAVTKETWEGLTDKFFDVDENGKKRIRNRMELTVLYEESNSIETTGIHTDSAQEDKQESDGGKSQIEAVCELVNKTDFTIHQPEISVSEKEIAQYKEAYLKILKSEIPTINQEGEREYFCDLYKAGTEFSELDEFYSYYFDDLDGDRAPEFAVKSIGYTYILKYVPEKEEFTIMFSGPTMYYTILGTGQMAYHDGLHAGVVRDRYIILNNTGEWETILDLQRGIQSPCFYEIGVGEYEGVDVGEANWNIVTAPFFKMAEQAIQPKTLEEIFGKLLQEQQ